VRAKEDRRNESDLTLAAPRVRLALLAKRVETRGWSTKYRGPLAIHAPKRCRISELISYACSWSWCGALAATGLRMGGDQKLDEILPFGAVIAVAELVDVRSTESFTVGEIETPRQPQLDAGHLYQWTERQMGDFGPGRFGWILENVRALPAPMPFNGHQGFFEVPDALLNYHRTDYSDGTCVEHGLPPGMAPRPTSDQPAGWLFTVPPDRTQHLKRT
jgi:hypothetical protein